MIIVEEEGDILSSGAQTIAFGCNTEGVMGKGMALQFKEKFPKLLPAYQRACKARVFSTDGFFLYSVTYDKKVLCVPTKRKWRNPSRLEWIDESLFKLAQNYERYGITSLAVPALGCGEGRLKWRDVYPIIRQHLDPIEIPVAVYLPFEPKK